MTGTKEWSLCDIIMAHSSTKLKLVGGIHIKPLPAYWLDSQENSAKLIPCLSYLEQEDQGTGILSPVTELNLDYFTVISLLVAAVLLQLDD